MLDALLKTKKMIPSPSQYLTEVNILPQSQNIYHLNDKQPRRTILGEIEHKAKLHKAPHLGQYKLKYESIEPRLPGGPVEKSDKPGALDDIEFRAKNTPLFYEKKYSQTLSKPKHAIIAPIPKKKDNPYVIK
jgi:hypothetical protein